MFLTIVLVTFLTSVFGGSVCPPRGKIYPCSCANIHQRRTKVSTIVTCHRLQDSDALNEIFPFLRSMRIDQFYMYDSFWQAHTQGVAGENKKALPSDFITLMKAKEIEIVDSTLSSCFACQWRLNCKNSVTTSFTVTNSSSSDKMCSLCDTGRGGKYPWTGCMNKLQEFTFNHGKLTSLGTDLFPMVMRELISLNLSYNQIVKIDSNALKNLPSLSTLDLSHNAIEYIDHMFGGKDIRLEFLDVSWNFIKTLTADLFSALPLLKTLKADNNVITELKESDWKNMPEKLRTIDLSSNPLHCDCTFRWINSTFDVNVDIRGTCSTPDEYQYSPVRRASRYLIQRCDTAGNIGTRRPTSKKPKRPTSKTPAL